MADPTRINRVLEKSYLRKWRRGYNKTYAIGGANKSEALYKEADRLNRNLQGLYALSRLPHPTFRKGPGPKLIRPRAPGRNVGSFKGRGGQWKKGKGGRFVGSA